MRIVTRRELRPEVVELIDRCPEGDTIESEARHGHGAEIEGQRLYHRVEWIQVVEEVTS